MALASFEWGARCKGGNMQERAKLQRCGGEAAETGTQEETSRQRADQRLAMGSGCSCFVALNSNANAKAVATDSPGTTRLLHHKHLHIRQMAGGAAAAGGLSACC